MHKQARINYVLCTQTSGDLSIIASVCHLHPIQRRFGPPFVPLLASQSQSQAPEFKARPTDTQVAR